VEGYGSTADLHCAPCPANCTNCSMDATMCMQCQSGFTLNSATGMCDSPKCDPHCNDTCAVQGAGKCDKMCAPGYGLNVSFNCAECPLNCKNCSATFPTCSECATGVMLNPDTKMCDSTMSTGVTPGSGMSGGMQSSMMSGSTVSGPMVSGPMMSSDGQGGPGASTTSSGQGNGQSPGMNSGLPTGGGPTSPGGNPGGTTGPGGSPGGTTGPGGSPGGSTSPGGGGTTNGNGNEGNGGGGDNVVKAILAAVFGTLGFLLLGLLLFCCLPRLGLAAAQRWVWPRCLFADRSISRSQSTSGKL